MGGGMDYTPLWGNLDVKIRALLIAMNQFPTEEDRLRAVDQVKSALLTYVAQIREMNSSTLTEAETIPPAELLLSKNWTNDEHKTLNFLPEASKQNDATVSPDLCSKKLRGRPKLGRVHICPHCSRSFKRPCLLRQHLSASHSEAPKKKVCIQCEQCGRLFRTSIGLKAHRKRYHEVSREVFRCLECTFASFSKTSFDKHMKKFHGPDKKSNSVCDICGKGFVTQNQLKMHREIHSTDKKYKCNQCSYTTNTLSGLRSHGYAQHNPDVRIYQCEMCKKQWKKHVLYKLHMEKHHHIKITTDKKPGPRSVCELPKEPVKNREGSLATLTAVPLAVPLHQQPQSNMYTMPEYTMPHGSEKNIPIPVLCAQMNSNDMSYVPQGSYNMETPKLDFDVVESSDAQDGTMITNVVTLPQNIHVATVMDDLLKQMNV